MGLGQMGALQSIIGANELLNFVKRYAKDIEITEESILFDSVKEVGIGGNFLERKETMKKFRNEYYFPKFLNRQRHGSWRSSGSLPMTEKFTRKAKEIIESDVPVFIDGELEAKFNAIIKEHEDFYGTE